jgi:AmiR/NasT family two-component response regulator
MSLDSASELYQRQDLTDSARLSATAASGYLYDELQAAEHRIENLEAALVNARKIGAAIGIMMASEKLTYEQAFSFLSLASQRSNEKLSQVAERVVLTGSAAPWPV